MRGNNPLTVSKSHGSDPIYKRRSVKLYSMHLRSCFSEPMGVFHFSNTPDVNVHFVHSWLSRIDLQDL